MTDLGFPIVLQLRPQGFNVVGSLKKGLLVKITKQSLSYKLCNMISLF